MARARGGTRLSPRRRLYHAAQRAGAAFRAGPQLWGNAGAGRSDERSPPAPGDGAAPFCPAAVGGPHGELAGDPVLCAGSGETGRPAPGDRLPGGAVRHCRPDAGRDAVHPAQRPGDRPGDGRGCLGARRRHHAPTDAAAARAVRAAAVPPS